MGDDNMSTFTLTVECQSKKNFLKVIPFVVYCTFILIQINNVLPQELIDVI